MVKTKQKKPLRWRSSVRIAWETVCQKRGRERWQCMCRRVVRQIDHLDEAEDGEMYWWQEVHEMWEPVTPVKVSQSVRQYF